jgi:hypothetical protein
MNVSQIELYDILKARVGEKEAKALVGFVEAEVSQKFADQKEVLATKRDIADLRVEMERGFKEQARLMFMFWIGQVAVIAGVLFAILNAYLK